MSCHWLGTGRATLRLPSPVSFSQSDMVYREALFAFFFILRDEEGEGRAMPHDPEKQRKCGHSEKGAFSMGETPGMECRERHPRRGTLFLLWGVASADGRKGESSLDSFLKSRTG